MKLKKVTLKNVGSFVGEHSFSLDDRGLVSIVGRNLDAPRAISEGAGKSTLLVAIDWCQWGKVPRDLESWEGAGNLAVCLDYDDNGVAVRIARYRGVKGVPNGPRLWVDGVDKSATDPEVTQKKIEEVLGLDEDVWHAAVLFPQIGRVSWATATDGQRKALLGRILPDLDRVEGLLDVAKQKLSDSDAHVFTVNGLLESRRVARSHVVQNLASVEPTLLFLQQQAAQHEQQQEQWRQQTAREAQEATAALQAIAAEVALWAPIVDVPPPTLPPDLIVEQQAARADLDEAIRRHAAAAGTLKHMQALCTQRTCPTCSQVLPAQQAAPAATALAAAQTEVNAAVAMGLAARARSTVADAALEQARQQAQAHHAQQAYAIGQERTRRAQVQQQDGAWRHKLAGLQQAMSRAPAPNPFHAQIAVTQQTQQTQQQRLVEIDAEILDLTARLQQHQRRSQVLSFWVGAFGTKGLRSYLLDSHLATMAAEINRWLALLTGGTTWATLSTNRVSGKGKNAKTIEQITLRVSERFPDGSVVEHELGDRSGGEQFRATLAVDFGLSRLIARRATKQYDFLLFDEVFRHIDDAGREAVLDLLREVAKERSTVVVVEHDRNLQAAIPNRIVVEKQHRRSRITEGA